MAKRIKIIDEIISNEVDNIFLGNCRVRSVSLSGVSKKLVKDLKALMNKCTCGHQKEDHKKEMMDYIKIKSNGKDEKVILIGESKIWDLRISGQKEVRTFCQHKNYATTGPPKTCNCRMFKPDFTIVALSTPMSHVSPTMRKNSFQHVV